MKNVWTGPEARDSLALSGLVGGVVCLPGWSEIFHRRKLPRKQTYSICQIIFQPVFF